MPEFLNWGIDYKAETVRFWKPACDKCGHDSKIEIEVSYGDLDDLLKIVHSAIKQKGDRAHEHRGFEPK